MAHDNDNDNEGVGFGRPPKQHQFKKGQSGNPRGRPKKSGRKPKPGEIDIARMLNAEFTLPTADGERKVGVYEIVCRGLATRAVNERNLRAAIQFVKRCEALNVIRTPPRRKTHGVLTISPEMTKEEIERQLYEEEIPRRKMTGKKADRVAILEAVAYELVGEGKNKRTTFEVVVGVIQRHAFAGNVTAVRMLDELHDRYDQPADTTVGGFVVVPGMATDIEAFNKLADEQQRQFREAPDENKRPQETPPVDRKGTSNRS
jgi:hypothetical protein